MFMILNTDYFQLWVLLLENIEISRFKHFNLVKLSEVSRFQGYRCKSGIVTFEWRLT